MLTYKTNNFKSFSQKYYDECINSIDFFNVTCTCNSKGSLTKHAYYTRKILTPCGIVYLRILRVKCSICNKTHAILLSSMVPFSQISISDHVDIILGNEDKVMNLVPDIDESTCYKIKRSFSKFFSQFLFQESIPISNLGEVIEICLRKLKRQFMQLKFVVKLSSSQIILLENSLIC